MVDEGGERWREVREELEALLGARVEPHQAHLSENLHFWAEHRRLGPLFIKVYGPGDRMGPEQIALGVLAAHHRWAISPVASGALPRLGTSWLAFPEVPLDLLTLDGDGCRRAAELLAEVHSTPVSRGKLPEKADSWTLVAERLARLTPWHEPYGLAVELFEQAESLLAAVGQEYSAQAHLLSGDFGARNLHIRKDSGMAVLLDFEHAAIGDTHWDLGKVWDQELADPGLREEFVGAYRQRAQLRDWPDPRVLWITRFAAAMGVFPYAARVDDADFFGHGVEKLVTLRGDLAALLR